MIGYDAETPSDAERRLERVYQLGFLPFCQLYQSEVPKAYGDDWRRVSRKWSRPAAYRGKRPADEATLFGAAS